MKIIKKLFQYHQNKTAAFLFIGFSTNAYSCINCNPKLKNAIAESYQNNTFAMFSAFIVLAGIITILTIKVLRHRNILQSNAIVLSPIPMSGSAIILGIGLGGFADGIVLHQILQWHEMLSNKIAPTSVINKSVNMFWDGIFHLFTFFTTCLGIYLFWKIQHFSNINKSGRLLLGGMLAGWGIFNLTEGVINHQILKLHNVRELSTYSDLWNYGFLCFGFFILLSGILLVKGQYKTLR
jgi:uncharacterized membrane protein